MAARFAAGLPATKKKSIATEQVAVLENGTSSKPQASGARLVVVVDLEILFVSLCFPPSCLSFLARALWSPSPFFWTSLTT